MKNIKKVTALTLVFILLTTSIITVSADIKVSDSEILNFVEPKYVNMDLQSLDVLINQNINNDNTFHDLIRAKAIKENKMIDKEYYINLCSKANSSRKDFDKLVSYIEGSSVFTITRDITEEEFQSLQSTYSLSGLNVTDFVIEESISYGAKYTNDEEHGIYNSIMNNAISIGTAFVKPVWSIVYTLLGNFDNTDVRYSRSTNVSTLNDIAYIGNLVRCKTDQVVYAIVNEEKEYSSIRTIQWNGSQKSADKIKDLGLVRFGYNSNYSSTTAKKQLGLDMYNIQGFKLITINKNSHYDKSYLFN